MASLWKHPKSKYWVACYTAHDGRQLKRSTKVTERKEAQKIADAYEDAARRKRTVHQTRRVITDLHKSLAGDVLSDTTFRSYAHEWLSRKAGETAPTTVVFYRSTLERFCVHLGNRAEMPISEISAPDILQFRNTRAEKVAATTTNHELKTLRTIFRAAKRDGQISDDPTETVQTLRGRQSRELRPFKAEEIRAVLRAADEEWRSMVICALYTGQRLSDIAALTWHNVDLQSGEVRLTTRKTGKRLTIPLAQPLRDHLEMLPTSDEPGAPLHPRAHRILAQTGRSGELSRQFGELLAQAGLRSKVTHKSTGKGRGGKRDRHELSFHALRRTATTWLHEAGVPAAVVQALIGHDSPEVHALYVSVGAESLRSAVKALPVVA